MRCAAQNHVVSGSLERCIVVPAVTEVCRPQSRHSCKRGRLFSPTTRRSPQPGHTKPSGQRCLNKNGLLQIEWVKRSGYSQVDSDSKGFLVNLPVTSWRHVCAHAKIDQDETPER